jgi:hypothetical protein
MPDDHRPRKARQAAFNPPPNIPLASDLARHRPLGRAVKTGVAKATAGKAAMVGYGGVMGAGSAVALAMHVAAWAAVAAGWL